MKKALRTLIGVILANLDFACKVNLGKSVVGLYVGWWWCFPDRVKYVYAK